MSFPAFAWSVRFFSLVAALGLMSLILGVNPEEKPWARVLFFVAFFWVTSSGTAWGLLSYYRRHVDESGVWRRRLLEQALLFGGLCTSLVSLEYFRALVWWTAGLVLAFFFLIELSLRQVSKKQQLSPK